MQLEVYKTRLQTIRQQMTHAALDALLVPMADEYLGEYCADYARRLQYLTGFSGSAGMVVVTQERALLFTDGRYTLQAAAEAPQLEIINSGDTSLAAWLKAHLTPGQALGADPRLHPLAEWQRIAASCEAQGVRLVVTEQNLVDAVWNDQPAPPNAPVVPHPLAYAGEDSRAKRQRLGAMLKDAKVGAALITACDSVMWLLNVRGHDVPMTPFAHSVALLMIDGDVHWWIDPARFTPELAALLAQDASIHVHVPNTLAEMLPALVRGDAKNGEAQNSGAQNMAPVALDPQLTPAWYAQHLQAAGVAHREIAYREMADPCQLAKAKKNPIELAGTRAAHLRDGAVLTAFLCWLDQALARGEAVDELTVMERLDAARAKAEHARGPSFTTIAGAGPNGAIVHYRATAATNRTLNNCGLFLLDSGGQYVDGTTDVTRTLAVGPLSAAQRRHYTLVLKGHIALARARFPLGTSGSQLDALARALLWAEGLDYDHGTGHGVGSYLSVHEGPQRISKRGGDTPLAVGMILSNEPGYYAAGSHGIRIENLVTVVPRGTVDGREFLGFDTLTCAPIDPRPVLFDLLTAEEKNWLAEYHAWVVASLSPQLSATEQVWLAAHVAPYMS